MKTRLLILLAAAAGRALAIAGCGGGSGGSGAEPATLIPAEGAGLHRSDRQPRRRSMKSNIEALAKNVAGVDRPRRTDRSKKSKRRPLDSEESFDFDEGSRTVAGRKGRASISKATTATTSPATGSRSRRTDTGAAEEFIDKFVEGRQRRRAEEGYFEGVEFKVETEDGEALGIVGDFVVFAETEKPLRRRWSNASKGESLSEEESFTSAMDAASSDSLANVFVDIGGLIKETAGTIDPETEAFLEAAGLEPQEATAVASLVPGSDQIEIDFASNVSGKNPTLRATPRKLLGSLPGGSFAAFASADFGKRFGEAIDRIDAAGIPGQIEPNELKSALSAAGIDLDKVSASIGDLGVFAQGNTEKNLTGAVVLTTKESKEATNTVSNIGLLLRAAGTPGVTAISGKATGFSVRDPELGRQPLVVAAEGDRIAISYGLAASAQALTAGQSATLAEDPAYKEAVAALGSTPISRLRRRPRGAGARHQHDRRHGRSRKASKRPSPIWKRSPSPRSAPAPRAN